MKAGALGSFGAQLKALRETAGFTQEELATIAGLSVHAVSALERGQRRRPHVDTVRALSAALDLTGSSRDALLESARAAATAPVDRSRAVSLPLALTIFLGRDADVQTLRLWLEDSTARLITLTGPGGAGKTRLALELARLKASEGARVQFVELAAVRDSALVAPAIAEALGVGDATPLDLPRRVRAACDGMPTLLVLDNFEQVLDAAPLVADLLAAVAALRVLVTSRAPLHVRGEREYAVGPLALDVDVDDTSPADLARCPAVRLFVERVQDVQPGFRLTSGNGPIAWSRISAQQSPSRHARLNRPGTPSVPSRPTAVTCTRTNGWTAKGSASGVPRAKAVRTRSGRRTASSRAIAPPRLWPTTAIRSPSRSARRSSSSSSRSTMRVVQSTFARIRARDGR